MCIRDRPYSGLDPRAAESLDELIASVRDGRSFVMVSHDIPKGLQLASHVLVMERGRQLFFGTADACTPAALRELCGGFQGGAV